jgi:hypothetical protein
MKTRQANEGRENVNSGSVFKGRWAGSCKAIRARISGTKSAIFAEARETLKLRDQMLRLALNEAEALAWQTLYPHLVFPALAAEKVQGFADWNNHQRLLGWQTRPLAF